jgi:CRISPR system Cascade subunit CasA
MTMASFDLIHQPWIPVMVAGTRTDVSLMDAVTAAGEIDGLAADDPLEAAAVFRQVLLPVVIDALGMPASAADWARRWNDGSPDFAAARGYLTEHAACFDLFDEVRPFVQVAQLRTMADDTKPVSLLIPSIATGNNVPLFSSRTEADPPALTPAQAARAVLVAHSWDTAAIKSGADGDPRVSKGKTTGNPTGYLGQLGVVIPAGRTLAQTLALSVPVSPQGLRPGDRPQWRADPAGPAWRQRAALGVLDLLTWQSRRIRLIPKTDDSGDLTISRVVLTAGDRLDQIPQDLEPHTPWKQVDKPKAGQAPQRPVRHVSGKDAWRGLDALLAIREPSDARVSAPNVLIQVSELIADGYLPPGLMLSVMIVGVAYGNQSAVVEDVISDQIPMPVSALIADGSARSLLLDIAGQAEALRVAANRLGDDLRRSRGAEPVPWDKSQRPGDVLIHQFTPAVTRILAGLRRNPDLVEEADAAWRAEARRLAWQSAEEQLGSVPPEAFLGRSNGGRVFRLADAEAWFRRSVSKVLGASVPSSGRPAPPSPLQLGVQE